MNPSSYPANLRARGEGSYLPSTFDAHFPAAGEYQFFCKIHPEFMTGIIRVVA
jgi:plastocyanin